MDREAWIEWHAQRGFATVPLRPREKRPLRKGWREGAASDWSNVPRDANLGVLTGSPSGGLVVLDFDTRSGPEEVLDLTPAQLAVLTIVVETARGWHVYARAPGEPTRTPLPGLDVRGEGAMVVAPPSVHPSGWIYRLVQDVSSVVDLAAIAPAEVLRTKAARREPPTGVEDWIALQAPKLQEAWARLKAPRSLSFDALRADFAVARCLWEGGYAREEIAGVLCDLPGSLASERGREYALITAERAAQVPSRGSGRGIGERGGEGRRG